MKEDKKERIAIKALELFALNGLDNTSISELQYALDMGRGTLYYYFLDKEDLFVYVMNTYFLIPKQQCLNISGDITVSKMINALLTYLHSLESLLQHFDNQNLNTSNVVTLMCTAYNRFPDLYKKAHRIYLKELDLWQQALQNEIRMGIIRPDIPLEMVATMFTHIKDGFDTGKYGVTMDFTIFDKQYNYLYQLLQLPK